MRLRDYQKSLVSQVTAAWQTHPSLMLQLPTGGGKTVVFSSIASEIASSRGNVLVLAHRQELLTQAASKLAAVTALPVGIVKAGIKPNYSAPIQVASVQSLARRLDAIATPDLIVVDEAHHATAKSYVKILDAFPQAFALGVTATPVRTDGKGFEYLFDKLLCGPSVAELMEQGYLSQYKLFADANPMNTKGVRRQGGDYSVADLARENDAVELSGNLVQSYRQYADGLKTIVFALNVEHSQVIVERYQAEGISAAHLDGTSTDDERSDTLAAFKRGDIQVLSNVMLFTEGFDLPAIQAVQIARPTQSLALHLQMLGRVLRPAEGKPSAVIIDHTKNWWSHGLPDEEREWNLLAPPKRQCRNRLQRTKNGEVIAAPAETRSVVETEAQLIEVTGLSEAATAEWKQIWNELVSTQQTRKYKPAWLRYELEKYSNVPLEVWRWCAEYLGYKKGWAWYRWKDSRQVAA